MLRFRFSAMLSSRFTLAQGLCGNDTSACHDAFIAGKTSPRLYKLRKKSSHLKLLDWFKAPIPLVNYNLDWAVVY